MAHGNLQPNSGEYDLQRRNPTAISWKSAANGAANGHAATFDPATDKDAAYQFSDGKHNIYFTVNRVSRRLGKKAAKCDIVEILYLQVDVFLSWR